MSDFETVLDRIAEHGNEEGLEMEVGSPRRPHSDGRAALMEAQRVQAIFEITDSKFPPDPTDIETVINSAREHGSYEDPGRQGGDLIDAIRAGWAIQDEMGREAVLQHEAPAPPTSKKMRPLLPDEVGYPCG